MKIVVIGQGGHSKVIRDMIAENGDYQLIGYLDDKFKEITVSENLIYGPVSKAHHLVESLDHVKFVIAIGNNETRKSVAHRIGLTEEYYLTLVQKTAVVSPSVQMGPGTVVMANAVINADAQIGTHAIINTGSVVEHDNRLSDFVHISPGATLTGAVVVEEGAHIGAGAKIIPNVKVGEWTIIGAGATVIKDIPPHCTAVGTPAIIIKTRTVHIS